MNKRRNVILTAASLACFFLVALTLFAVYFTETDTESPTAFNIACGVSFWLFLAAGIALQAIVSGNIKRWYIRRKLYRSRLSKKRVGLLSLFGNPPAIVSDVLLAVSPAAFIIFMITAPSELPAYISLSVLFFSFCAHCIFNGKNYYYITNYEHIKSHMKKAEEKK